MKRGWWTYMAILSAALAAWAGDTNYVAVMPWSGMVPVGWESNITAVVSNTLPRARRSGKWSDLRDEQVRLYPWCAVCGDSNRLQAHHIAPFRTHPELELEATNVIVLCDGWFMVRRSGCHYKVGHLGNFNRDNGEIENQYGRGSNAVGWAVQEARRGK